MLEQKIFQDYIQAMKDHDAVKSAALNFLRAQLKNAAVDKRVKALEDAEVVAVIKKQIKQRQESIAQFAQGGRQDLVEKESGELTVLKGYLPAELSLEVIEGAVAEVIKETGAKSMKDMGAVMKAVIAKLQGRADSKAVSDLVRKALSGM